MSVGCTGIGMELVTVRVEVPEDEQVLLETFRDL
jgi:hypothetical protein